MRERDDVAVSSSGVPSPAKERGFRGEVLIPLERWAGDAVPGRFSRGKRYPRAIAWYGIRSFWGHLWHLAASVIATEDIDSRDWMRPLSPGEFTRRVVASLGGRAGSAETATEMLGRDVWIDFVADTGDDAAVGATVADWVTTVFDAEGRELPRGDILLFGGDTAYPVATELEIHNRVIVPWNEVLLRRDDGKQRVIMGVPGNHDWYAGLDGFGRMFRERVGELDLEPLEEGGVDRLGQVGQIRRWLQAFRLGAQVVKRPVLPMHGYVPLQVSTYWALRLAPKLELWGPDRQLRVMDFFQRAFFSKEKREKEFSTILCVADPIHAFLEPNPNGQAIVDGLSLDLHGESSLVLAGDTHHYCRETIGKSMHVTAGGGGAFLHPAAVARAGRKTPECEFPGPIATRSLLKKIPRTLLLGRAGFLVHLAVALLYAPLLLAAEVSGTLSVSGLVAVGLLGAGSSFLVGGWRGPAAKWIFALSLLVGLIAALTPMVMFAAIEALLAIPLETKVLVTFAVSTISSVMLFATFLATLTWLGLEQYQAFSSLAHPGYKHFVRLRVSHDGKKVEGWAIGKVDPLDPKTSPVLVDHFMWMNPRTRL